MLAQSVSLCVGRSNDRGCHVFGYLAMADRWNTMPLLSNPGSSTSTHFICVHCASADDVYLEIYRLVPLNVYTVYDI